MIGSSLVCRLVVLVGINRPVRRTEFRARLVVPLIRFETFRRGWSFDIRFGKAGKWRRRPERPGREFADKVTIAHAHADDFLGRPVRGAEQIIRHCKLQQFPQISLFGERFARQR